MASSKIYVGNFSWNTNDEILFQAFSAYGSVLECIVMKDKETKRSRGFGFVTFGSMPEAEAAIASMNKGELDGRRIRVNLANSRGLGTVPGWPDRQGYGGGGYMYQSGYGPRDESSKITTNTGFDQKTPPRPPLQQHNLSNSLELRMQLQR
jgi:cold-inducible RNA-binding protein